MIHLLEDLNSNPLLATYSFVTFSNSFTHQILTKCPQLILNFSKHEEKEESNFTQIFNLKIMIQVTVLRNTTQTSQSPYLGTACQDKQSHDKES